MKSLSPHLELPRRRFKLEAVMPMVPDKLTRLFECDPVSVGKIFDIGFAHCRRIARLIRFSRLRCHGRPCKCTLPGVLSAMLFLAASFPVRSKLDRWMLTRMFLIIAHGVYIVTTQVLTEPRNEAPNEGFIV